MTAFIHIGLRKTGTTSLQRILHSNEDRLRGAGVNYVSRVAGLRCKEANAHHFLAHSLLDKRHGYTPEADFSELDAHVAALREAILAEKGASVLSSEDFSRLNPSAVGKLAAILQGVETKVVVYLRRQDAWADSLYGQMLKVGRDLTAQEFLDGEKHSLDFEKFLQPWEESFGTQNIIVRVYEGDAKDNIWKDFCNAIGKPEAVNSVDALPKANKSLSYESTKFLNALGDSSAQKALRPIFENIEHDLPSSEGLKYLSVEQASQLMDGAKKGNVAVATKHLQRDRLFNDDRKLSSRESLEITADEFARVAGLVIARLAGRVTALEKKVTAMRKEK